jgi:hypothetical protein
VPEKAVTETLVRLLQKGKPLGQRCDLPWIRNQGRGCDWDGISGYYEKDERRDSGSLVRRTAVIAPGRSKAPKFPENRNKSSRYANLFKYSRG